MIQFQIGASCEFGTLTFSPDPTLLGLVTPHASTIADATSGKRVLHANRGEAGSATFFWGGVRRRTLFVNDSANNGLFPLDADTESVLPPVTCWINAPFAAFTTDGSHVVYPENEEETGVEALCGMRREGDGFVLTWTRFARDRNRYHEQRPLCFLPGGERFVHTEMPANWSPERVVILSNAIDGAPIGQWFFPHASTGSAACSPDANWLALVHKNSPSCYLYRVDQFGRAFAKLTDKSRAHVFGISFHPSGRLFATAGNSGMVSFYDTATWKVAKTFDWKIGKLRCVAFSPDGALAAVGSDKGQVVVWDVDV